MSLSLNDKLCVIEKLEKGSPGLGLYAIWYCQKNSLGHKGKKRWYKTICDINKDIKPLNLISSWKILSIIKEVEPDTAELETEEFRQGGENSTTLEDIEL